MTPHFFSVRSEQRQITLRVSTYEVFPAGRVVNSQTYVWFHNGDVVEIGGYGGRRELYGCMIECCLPNAIINIQPDVKNAMLYREAPSDDLPVTNNDNSALCYPQTMDFHPRVDGKSWGTCLEIENRDCLALGPRDRRQRSIR